MEDWVRLGSPLGAGRTPLDQENDRCSAITVISTALWRSWTSFGAAWIASSTTSVPATGGIPRVNFSDTGTAFVLQADLPGVKDADLSLTLEQDVLTLSGQRRADAPEGYAAYRQERAPHRFTRSFALPAKVDPEKTLAVLQHGVLTVTLEKAAEAQPRKIAVRVA